MCLALGPGELFDTWLSPYIMYPHIALTHCAHVPVGAVLYLILHQGLINTVSLLFVYTAVPASWLTRQLWGLTARCERAIRAIAPRWRAQASIWGETEVLFERLLLPTKWLCQAHLEMAGISLPPAAIRLLTSSVATAAKAAQLTGTDPSILFELLAAHLPQATAVCLPAVRTLLLPRIGAATAALPDGTFKFLATMSALECGLRLVEAVDPGGPRQRPSSQAMSAHVLRMLSSCHVSVLIQQLVSQVMGGAEHKPKAAALHLREVAHLAIGSLSDYGQMMVSELWSAVEATLGDCGETAAAALPTASGLSSREELRNSLRWTIRSLLGSPLLDFLARVQHILVKTGLPTDVWSLPAASFLPPVHQMPASMDPDAPGFQEAMQVGGSTQCMHWIYRSREASA